MYIVGLERVYLKIPGIGECRYKTMPEVSYEFNVKHDSQFTV